MAALRKWKPKIANNWMAWCKSDLPGKWLFWVNFFSSKVPEFLHTLFNLVVKHSPVFFGWFALCFWGKTRLTWVTFSGTEFCLREGQKKKTQWCKGPQMKMLLFCFVLFIVHTSILCPNQSKNTGECFTT